MARINEIHRNESKEMRNVVKITESDLHAIVEDAANRILREYCGQDKKDAKKRGIKSANAVKNGDSETYNKNVIHLTNSKHASRKLNSFQKSFEKGIREEEEDFNEQPANNLVGENQMKLSESQLFELLEESVKNVLAEIDWRTVANAADIAGIQSMDEKLPQGLRRKRTDQWQNFKGDVRPRMMKQYDLSNDEVADAIKGKGPFYKSASRKALRNMDKLNADYNKFYGYDREHPAKYEDGKWQ